MVPPPLVPWDVLEAEVDVDVSPLVSTPVVSLDVVVGEPSLLAEATPIEAEVEDPAVADVAFSPAWKHAGLKTTKGSKRTA